MVDQSKIFFLKLAFHEHWIQCFLLLSLWYFHIRRLFFKLFSYPLAKKTDDFTISVVSGYDVVPRMTIRGLGHLIMSVADLINNSYHSKQSILCCSGRCGWEPDIDEEAIEARQAVNLNELKLPNTETDDNHDQYDDHTALTSDTRERKRLKFGKSFLMEQLALSVAKKDTGTASSVEAIRPMVFTPGQIIHLEVTQVDKMKVLVTLLTSLCSGVRVTICIEFP